MDFAIHNTAPSKSSQATATLNFEDWGLIDYLEAEQKQLSLLQKISLGKKLPTIIFCSHPAIVTLGRATQPTDYTDWTGSVATVSRGGKATYHGPSQLVIYPLIDLSKPLSPNLPARDIRAFIEGLCKCLALTLGKFDPALATVTPHYGSTNKSQNSKTGLWINDQKIASIGIAVKKWITYHGAALNWYTDTEAFKGLRPCGFASSIMTSVEEVTHHTPNLDDYKTALKLELTNFFCPS